MTNRNDKKFHLLQLNPTTKKMEAKTNRSSNINMPVVDKIKQLKRNLNNQVNICRFNFQQRHGKLDIKLLERIDLDDIIDNNNIEQIHNSIENITFAKIEVKDLNFLADALQIKLYHLFQFAVEYFLNMHLHSSQKALKYKKQNEKLKLLSKSKNEYNKLLLKENKHLKQGMNLQCKALMAYENLLLRGIQDKNTPYTYNIVTEWREKFEIFNAKNKMKNKTRASKEKVKEKNNISKSSNVENTNPNKNANASSSSSSDLTTLKPVLEKVVERALVKQAHVTRKQEVEDELNLINMQLKKAEQQLKVVKSEENLKNITNSSILEKLDILAKRGEELFAKQQQVTTDTKPTTPIMQVEMKKESRTVSTQSPKARRYLFKAGDRVEADVEWDEYYPGTVKNVNDDGTYFVIFDDGEEIERVLERQIQKKSIEAEENMVNLEVRNVDEEIAASAPPTTVAVSEKDHFKNKQKCLEDIIVRMRTKKLRDTVTNWKLHIAHLKYLKIQHEKEEFQATSLKMQEEIDLLKAQKLVYEENQKKLRTKISSFAPKDTVSGIYTEEEIALIVKRYLRALEQKEITNSISDRMDKIDMDIMHKMNDPSEFIFKAEVSRRTDRSFLLPDSHPIPRHNFIAAKYPHQVKEIRKQINIINGKLLEKARKEYALDLTKKQYSNTMNENLHHKVMKHNAIHLEHLEENEQNKMEEFSNLSDSHVKDYFKNDSLYKLYLEERGKHTISSHEFHERAELNKVLKAAMENIQIRRLRRKRHHPETSKMEQLRIDRQLEHLLKGVKKKKDVNFWNDGDDVDEENEADKEGRYQKRPPSPPLPPKTDSPPLPSRNSANSPPPLPAREIPSPTERNNTNDNEKSPPQNMNLLTQKSNASNAKNTPKIQIPARQRAVSAGRRMLSKKTPSPRNSGNIVTSPSPVSPKSPFSNPKKIVQEASDSNIKVKETVSNDDDEFDEIIEDSVETPSSSLRNKSRKKTPLSSGAKKLWSMDDEDDSVNQSKTEKEKVSINKADTQNTALHSTNKNNDKSHEDMTNNNKSQNQSMILDSFNESSFASSFGNSPGVVSHNNRYYNNNNTNNNNRNTSVELQQRQPADKTKKESPKANNHKKSKSPGGNDKKNKNNIDDMAVEDFNMDDEDLDDDDWF